MITQIMGNDYTDKTIHTLKMKNKMLNPKTSQKIAFTVLFLSTLITIIPVIFIVIVIIKNGKIINKVSVGDF